MTKREIINANKYHIKLCDFFHLTNYVFYIIKYAKPKVLKK